MLQWAGGLGMDQPVSDEAKQLRFEGEKQHKCPAKGSQHRGLRDLKPRVCYELTYLYPASTAQHCEQPGHMTTSIHPPDPDPDASSD
eukprot:1157599-Pelagomonas_calceolata.AAC.4